MELKQGYKQTEVGLISEDWGITELGKIGVFAKGSGVRKDQSNSGEIACVRYGELYTKHNNYIKTFHSFISKEVSLQAKKLKKGDILFAGSGETKAEIGKSAAFIDDIDAYAGGDIVILTPKEFDSLYLGYLLNASFIQTQKASRGQGDAVVHISSNNLSTIQIPQPPLPEQTAIANALSDMDALISQTEKLIEKKKAIKQGVMQELLKPKDGWVTKKLGELLKYEQPTAYIVTGTEYHPNNETPVLTAGKSFILGYTNEINNIFENTPVVIFDDFTTSCQYVDFRFKVKSSAMKILKPANDNVNMRFAFEVLKSIKYQVGDHKRHWIGEFINFEVIIPSKIEEQNRIGQIIEDIEKEQQSYQVKLSKLKQQKQGMMQTLLTGKIRLVS